MPDMLLAVPCIGGCGMHVLCVCGDDMDVVLGITEVLSTESKSPSPEMP